MDRKRAVFAPIRVNPVRVHAQESRLSLSGEWNFILDPDDHGEKEKWWVQPSRFIEKIQVPGCWQGQGFGNESRDKILDFQFEVQTFRSTYTGTGWYAKNFNIPLEWKGKRLCLNFGGVHPSAEVWLNGVHLGSNNLPFVPFGFDITDMVDFQKKNELVVRVHEENRILGLSYNWQGNWSGLYRTVELVGTGRCFIESFWIYPDVDRGVIQFRVKIGDFDPKAGPSEIQVCIQPHRNASVTIQETIKVSTSKVNFEIPVPSPLLWSPDAPNLYIVDAVLSQDKTIMDAISERTGFIKLETKDKHFLINGEPYYMRGSGDFISCPETGCPDTNRDRWRKKLKKLREYGYNYVRCQSYVYPPEYFDVADEVGLLVQSEMGMLGAWADNKSPWHGSAYPEPTPGYYHNLRQQWEKIVQRDINHPSANLYCMSNELGTKTLFPKISWQCYQQTKTIKPTSFVIWTDGGYNPDLPGDFVSAFVLYHSTCQPVTHLVEYKKSDKPVIAHEFAWWSSFPDVRIKHKYSGAIRPYAIEIAEEAAAAHGIEHLLPVFAEKSQKLQFLEAKAKMELCRRDIPWLAGISHFNAMDTNPSPQGIIDEFYQKKMIEAQTWLQTNGDTVILSSLGFDDRVLEGGSEFKCKFFVSDFSHPPMKSPSFEWRISVEGKKIVSGSLVYSHQPWCTHSIGEVSFKVPLVCYSVFAQLEALLFEGNRCVRNSWNIWLFPCSIKLPETVMRYGECSHTWLKGWKEIPFISRESLMDGKKNSVVLTEYFDEPIEEFLRRGGKVILAAGEGLVHPHRPSFVFYNNYFFTPPANYPPYEDGQNGTVVTAHPLLGDFPNEGFADFQFFRMIQESPPLDLIPVGLAEGEPVIRVIHRYPVNYPLAYIIERSLGQGRLVICALNLNSSWPEAQYLLSQICAYLSGEKFTPAVELSEKTTSFLREVSFLQVVSKNR